MPAIDTKILNEEDETWLCRTCVFAAGAKKGGAESEGTTGKKLWLSFAKFLSKNLIRLLIPKKLAMHIFQKQ